MHEARTSCIKKAENEVKKYVDSRSVCKQNSGSSVTTSWQAYSWDLQIGEPVLHSKNHPNTISFVFYSFCSWKKPELSKSIVFGRFPIRALNAVLTLQPGPNIVLSLFYGYANNVLVIVSLVTVKKFVLLSSRKYVTVKFTFKTSRVDYPGRPGAINTRTIFWRSDGLGTSCN